MPTLTNRIQGMPPEKRLYTLNTLPSHLHQAEQSSRLLQILLSYQFLYLKLQALDVNALIVDCGLASHHEAVHLIRSTLLNMAHSLESEHELGSQLWARLLSQRNKVSTIRAFLTEIEASDHQHCLSLFETYLQAGGTLQRTINVISVVNCLAVSDDGEFLISGHGSYMDPDFTLKVWRWQTGELIRVLGNGDSGHSDQIACISLQGDRVLTGSHDGTTCYWDWRKGTLLSRFGDPSPATEEELNWCTAVLGVANYLIAGFTDGLLQVWDLGDTNWQADLAGHGDLVSALVFQPPYIFSGSDDGTIRLWEHLPDAPMPFSEEPVKILKNPLYKDGTPDYITCLAIQAEHLFCGQMEGPILIWNWKTEELLGDLGTASESTLALVVRESLLWSVGGNRTVRAWDWTDRKLLKTLGSHGWSATAIALTKDAIISGSYDTTIKTWRIDPSDTKDKILSIQATDNEPDHEKPFLNNQPHGHDFVSALVVQGDYLLSGSHDGTVRIWKWFTGQHIRTLPVRDLPDRSNELQVMALSVLGDICFAAATDETITVWNWKTGDLIRTLGTPEPDEEKASWLRSLALDNNLILSAGDDGVIRVWNWQQNRLLRELGPLESDGITEIMEINCIARSGPYCLAGSDENLVRVWNWHNGELIRVYSGHKEIVAALAVSGDFAMSGGHESPIHVWNWKTGEVLRKLDGHTDTIRALIANGQHLLSGSYDQQLILWDWANGNALVRFTGDSPIQSVVLLRNNGYIISGDSAGRIHVHRIQAHKP